jgi:hypothetical protein
MKNLKWTQNIKVISINNINRLIFVTEMHFAFFDVGIEI